MNAIIAGGPGTRRQPCSQLGLRKDVARVVAKIRRTNEARVEHWWNTTVPCADNPSCCWSLPREGEGD